MLTCEGMQDPLTGSKKTMRIFEILIEEMMVEEMMSF